ncbi:FAD-dependent amine oxidoreductase [uncultured virus]|nr:FAD-dependent amine oxidoreductase [uncultured virus]
MYTDILIVGAGISGIYAAWRLSRKFPNLSITVIDKNNYIGGRLLSIPFGNDEIYAELGGMRVFPSQKYTNKLLQIFDVETVVVPYVEPQNLGYFRGKRFTYDVLNEDGRSGQRRTLIRKYCIPKRQQQESINTIIDTVVDNSISKHNDNRALISADPRLNRIKYLEFLKLNGVSDGVINVNIDFGGYNTDRTDVAASAILSEHIPDAPGNIQHFIVDGFQSLVTKMANVVFKGPNTKLILTSTIENIRTAEKGFKCNVKDKNNLYHMIKPRKILFTLNSYEMTQIKAPWSDEALVTINNVELWDSVKIFLLVDNETYDLLSMNGKLEGRCVTDLPLRQVWLYSKDPPCLLIYNDDNTAFYWRSFFNEKYNNNPKWRNPESDEILIDELRRQIGIMFNVCQSKIKITKILYKFWIADLDFWKPCDIPKMKRNIETPFGKDLEAYSMGAAFGYDQGWTDGAIENTDTMLSKYFKTTSLLTM